MLPGFVYLKKKIVMKKNIVEGLKHDFTGLRKSYFAQKTKIMTILCYFK